MVGIPEILLFVAGSVAYVKWRDGEEPPDGVIIDPLPGVEFPAPNGESTVTTLADAKVKVAAAAEGEHVILNATGSVNNPAAWTVKAGVIFRSKTVGGATITGQPVSVGDRAWLYGFVDRANAPATGMTIGDNAVVKRCKINLSGTTTSKWIICGQNVKLDHCEIFGKTTAEQMIQTYEPGLEMNKCHLHDMSWSGGITASGNREPVMIGWSKIYNSFLNANIHDSLFEKLSSEYELMTIKSCGNKIHHCTFKNNGLGAPTFRHGHNRDFDHNVCIGTGFRGYGYNDKITNNAFIDNPYGFMIGNGNAAGDAGALLDPPQAGYEPVRNNVYEHNLHVQTIPTTALTLGYSVGGASIQPINNAFRENIVYGTTATALTAGTNWANQQMDGGIVFGPNRGSMPGQNIDPKLIKGPDGLWRFSPDSPLTWTQGLKVLTAANVGPGAA